MPDFTLVIGSADLRSPDHLPHRKALPEAVNVGMVKEFLTWQRDVRGRQASSVYDYATRLQRLLLHLGRTPLGEVRLEQLESWITRIRSGRAHGTIGAPASRAKDVAVARSLYAYLHARGLVEGTPPSSSSPPPFTTAIPSPSPTTPGDGCGSARTCPRTLGSSSGLASSLGYDDRRLPAWPQARSTHGTSASSASSARVGATT